MSDKKVRPFGIIDKIGYAFGDMGNDLSFILSSTFMLKFYTDIMGIEAALVGLLMMLARFVDAFTDVAMGQIVDRSKPTKFGKFRPWILRMAGPVAIASFLVFQSEFAGMDYAFKVVWMFVTYLLWGSIFYTAINIPYGSMASAISEKSEDRVQLATFRTIGATIASIAIGAGTPLIAYVTAENGATVLSGERMWWIALAFSVLAIVCYLLCFKMTTERVRVPQNTQKLSLKKLAKTIFTSRALLGLIGAAIMLLIALLGMSGMAAYVFPVYYNSAAGQSLSSLISQLAALLIIAPTIGMLTKKFGKKEVAVVGCVFTAIVYLVCFIMRPDNVYVYLAFYSVAWVGMCLFNTPVWAFITDVIDDSEVRNGIREDGTIYSVYSFARKLGQAFSSGLIGTILSAYGYSAAVAANPTAYPSVLDAIFNVSCILPAAGLIAVALMLAFVYPLSKRKVLQNQKILAERAEKTK